MAAETHRQSSHKTEEHAEGDSEPRFSHKSGQHDHQIDGCGHDVGRKARADLPSEPSPIDPRTEAIEPPLVYLPVMNRKVEAPQPRI